MGPIICVFFITISIWKCDGVSLREQLDHIVARRKESQGIPKIDIMPSLRRLFDYDPGKSSVILGAPSLVSHLPAAEPILPAHTLIRPSVDMLKSSIKFPHKAMEDGAGVYGNIDHLGLKWDGRSERVLYSGFRRKNDRDETMMDYAPLRRNDIEATRKRLSLHHGYHPRKKRFRLKNDRAVLYESIYKNEHEGPKVIKIPHLKTRQIKKFRIILEKIRREVERKKATKQQASYFRKSSNKRRRPRASPAYAYINLDNLNKVLRSNAPSLNNPKDSAVAVLRNSGDDSSDESSSDDVHEELIEEEKEPPIINNNVVDDPKLTWFWNSKDAFNHIKIRPEAPELYELMPVVDEDNEKKWWFFHESDFQPFEKLD